MKNVAIAITSGLLIKDMPIWEVKDMGTVITLVAAMLVYILLVWIDCKREERLERRKKLSRHIERAVNTKNRTLMENHIERE